MNKGILIFCVGLAAGVLLYLLFAGGSDDHRQKEFATDTQEYSEAIEKYLSRKGFGMKVASFESLVSDGDTAKAACKMEHAEGIYNMKVVWAFTFKKKRGVWEATGHETEK